MHTFLPNNVAELAKSLYLCKNYEENIVGHIAFPVSAMSNSRSRSDAN
jgi:hypothetical protein